MKERLVDCKRAVIAHDQTPEVAEPSDGALDDPAAAVTPPRVAVFGVGGLGHLALQIAKLSGAETIAVDVSEAKLEFARKLGAAQAILATDANTHELLKAGGGPGPLRPCRGAEK